MPNSLIKQYFYANVNNIGDLETYSEEPRIVDHLIDGNIVRFHIAWFPEENEKPKLLEIHVSIRSVKNKIHKKAWIYRKGEDWEIQEY